MNHGRIAAECTSILNNQTESLELQFISCTPVHVVSMVINEQWNDNKDENVSTKTTTVINNTSTIPLHKRFISAKKMKYE